MQIKHSELKSIFKCAHYDRFTAGSILCETKKKKMCACAVSGQILVDEWAVMRMRNLHI